MPQNDRINNTERLQSEVYLDGFLAEFRQALRDEIKEIEKNGLSSIQLKEGHRLYSSSGFWYQFKIDYLPNIPADTPCKLTIGSEDHDVTVIAFDDSNLTIEAKEELPNTIAEAKLENGTTVLLELLIKRIEKNSTKANPAGQRMMQASNEEIQVVDSNGNISFGDNLDVAQIEAITSAVCNNMTFIWGPPGTGKTTVISHVISELLSRERSVLLVSHTNSAVDGAIKETVKKYDKKHKGHEDERYPILRLGAGGQDLDDRVREKTHIEVANHDLMLEKEKLEKEFEEVQKRVAELNIIITKFNWIQNTQINTIKVLSNSISEITLSIKAKKEQLTSIHQEVQTQLATHPEYQEATDLNRTIKEAENEIVFINERISSLYTEINDLTKRAQEAKDEIAKHEQYEELKGKEAKYFTEKTLKDKIEECKRRVITQEEWIAANKKLIEKAQQVIQQYESKNSIGKFFSSKKDYEQAIATVSGLTSKSEEAQRIMDAAKLNGSEYETQLVELMSIKSRLAETHPSKTRLVWESELKWCNAKIAQLKIELEDKKNKKVKALDSKDKADARLQEIQVVCKAIDSLLANLEATKAELDSFQKKHNDLEIEFSKMISNERSLCFDVYCISDGFKPCDIEGLETALENAKNDIVGKDKNDIQIEIKDLEGKQESIIAEQKEIDKKIAEVSKQVINQAKVIGTTLAKSYLSDDIQNRTFDTIILDEASMAAIPALWCAAQVAEKNIVIVGDFLQLPPIVIAQTNMAKKWLGRDIFKVSGAQDIYKTGAIPPCFMLNRQFRMKKEIAEVVNMYYKEYSRLESDDKNERLCEKENKFRGWYNYDFERELYTSFRREHCIHLLDTKSLNAWVTSIPSGKTKSSRLNAFSAVLSVELAFKLLENVFANLVEPEKDPLVLIVAPYKPHVKRIEQLIQDKYRAMGYAEDMNLIKTGTIHSFQGKEADIVIFDLVIDEPHYIANLFLPNEEVNSELQKMFNVAITRARFKLFFIGNFQYCAKKAKSNALGTLLNYLMSKKGYPLKDAKTYFPNMTYSRPSTKGIQDLKYMMEICKEDVFLSKLKCDIRAAKKRIIIYSPFMTEKAVSPLLPYLKDSFNKGCSIIVITKTIDEVSPGLQSQKRKCEMELTQSGIHVIHKKWMHEKVIIIDDDIVWIGSLNVLSFGGTTKEVMCKIISKEGAKEFAEIFDIQHILEVTDDEEERKCPICGKEVIMAESDSAGYYWRCSDKEGCGWSRQPEEQYPHDGKLVCPKCGGEYSLSMKNEPRWICENNPRHYRKIRRSDLKLVKMWEGVPKKTVTEVEDYFKALAEQEESEKLKKKPQQPSKKSKTKIKSPKPNAPDLFSNQGSSGKGKKDNGQLSLF